MLDNQQTKHGNLEIKMKNPDEKWFKLLREEASRIKEADDPKELENQKIEGLKAKLQALVNAAGGAMADLNGLSTDPAIQDTDYITYKKVIEDVAGAVKALETLDIKPEMS